MGRGSRNECLLYIISFRRGAGREWAWWGRIFLWGDSRRERVAAEECVNLPLGDGLK